MKTVTVPPLVTPQTEGNLSDLPVHNGNNRPHHVAFSKQSSGTWVDVTNAEFLADVRALAKGLMAAPFRPNRTPRRSWNRINQAPDTASIVSLSSTFTGHPGTQWPKRAQCSGRHLEPPTAR